MTKESKAEAKARKADEAARNLRIKDVIAEHVRPMLEKVRSDNSTIVEEDDPWL